MTKLIPARLFLVLLIFEEKVAVACADGSASVSRLQTDGLELLREWTEPRLKTGQRYIGLAATSSAYVVHLNTLDPIGLRTINYQSLFLHLEWRPPPHAVGGVGCRASHGSSTHASLRMVPGT